MQACLQHHPGGGICPPFFVMRPALVGLAVFPVFVVAGDGFAITLHPAEAGADLISDILAALPGALAATEGFCFL